MNSEDLQELVEKLSLDYFKKPFQHQATFNLKLRTTGGRYLLNSHNLEFNIKILEQYGLEELVGIIKHELCHYHLHIEDKGYQHRDADFKSCIEETGGLRFAKPLENKKEKSYRYQLVCKKCGFMYNRKRRVNVKRYRCGKCNGELTLKEI